MSFLPNIVVDLPSVEPFSAANVPKPLSSLQLRNAIAELVCNPNVCPSKAILVGPVPTIKAAVAVAAARVELCDGVPKIAPSPARTHLVTGPAAAPPTGMLPG